MRISVFYDIHIAKAALSCDTGSYDTTKCHSGNPPTYYIWKGKRSSNEYGRDCG